RPHPGGADLPGAVRGDRPPLRDRLRARVRLVVLPPRARRERPAPGARARPGRGERLDPGVVLRRAPRRGGGVRRAPPGAPAPAHVVPLPRAAPAPPDVLRLLLRRGDVRVLGGDDRRAPPPGARPPEGGPAPRVRGPGRGVPVRPAVAPAP